MSIKVSIILTVHNAENTLQSCIESAMNQTLRDIEILCIDGGSRDDSPKILEKNAKVDNRIRIINDNNTSYGHKINRGVMEANGEYISILESDDVMQIDMLEKLYSYAIRYGVDFVDGNYEAVCYFKDLKYSQLIEKYSNESCYNNVIAYDERGIVLKEATGAIWTGLYKRSFIRNNNIYVNESEGAAFQDTSFRFLVGMYANKSYHIRDSVYLYRVDNFSSSIHDQKKIFAIANEYDFLKKELKSRSASNIEWGCFYKWKYSSYFWNSSRLDEEARNEFLKLYKDELMDDINKGNLVKSDMGKTDYAYTYLMLENYSLFKSNLEVGNRNRNFSAKFITEMLVHIYGRKIVVFGCGIKGKRILNGLYNAKVSISCICENNVSLQGTEYLGIKIYSVEEAVKIFNDHLYLIASGKYAEEMKVQLSELNVSNDNMYIVEF